MRPAESREITLSLAEAEEGAHMHHPDFRAHGRIFATLACPDESTGMVKLSLADQKRLIDQHPHTFYPAEGAWGTARQHDGSLSERGAQSDCRGARYGVEEQRSSRS